MFRPLWIHQTKTTIHSSPHQCQPKAPLRSILWIFLKVNPLVARLGMKKHCKALRLVQPMMAWQAWRSTSKMLKRPVLRHYSLSRQQPLGAQARFRRRLLQVMVLPRVNWMSSNHQPIPTELYSWLPAPCLPLSCQICKHPLLFSRFAYFFACML